NSAGGHRRDGADAAARPGAPRHARAAGRLRRHARERVRGVDAPVIGSGSHPPTTHGGTEVLLLNESFAALESEGANRARLRGSRRMPRLPRTRIDSPWLRASVARGRVT